MSDFTFITKEQFYEEEILKKRGRKAVLTDFSILQGAVALDRYIEKDSLKRAKTGYYWTKSEGFLNEENMAVDCDGVIYRHNVFFRDCGARVALMYSSLDEILVKSISNRRAKDGILEIEYGHYPQKAVSKDMQNKLEELYKNGELKRTENIYTTDSREWNATNEVFSKESHMEYEYKGKRYVRIKAKFFVRIINTGLSNGEIYNYGENVWVEVLPIKWLVNEKSKMMITEKIIFAGIRFNNKNFYDMKDFDKTEIKMFMDKFFSKEIEQVMREKQKSQELDSSQESQKERLQNGYEKIVNKYEEKMKKKKTTQEEIEDLNEETIDQIISELSKNMTDEKQYLKFIKEIRKLRDKIYKAKSKLFDLRNNYLEKTNEQMEDMISSIKEILSEIRNANISQKEININMMQSIIQYYLAELRFWRNIVLTEKEGTKEMDLE